MSQEQLAPRLSGRADCLAVTFDSEAETVLLLPNSGEVLLCATQAWEEVVNSGIFSNSSAEGLELSADAENLLATLDRLGIDLG